MIGGRGRIFGRVQTTGSSTGKGRKMTKRKFVVPSFLRSGGAGTRRSLFRSVAIVSALAIGSLGIVVANATEAAAAAPTITVTPTTVGPGQFVQVSGANWTANTTVFVSVAGVNFCNPTASATGTVGPVACGVPGVPVGSKSVVATQSSLSAQTTLTIKPRVTSFPNSHFSPGATIHVNAGGFASGSVVRAFLDTTTSTALVTNPVTPTTDASGNMNGLSITLPAAGVTTGAHSLILQDGSSNKVTKAITIYKPTFSLAASSGNPTSGVVVSGSGWRPSDTVFLFLGSTNYCNPTARADGTFSTACPIPAIPNGAHPTLAEQDSNTITATSTSFTVNAGVTFFPSPAASPGATIRVDTEGLAASSSVTALLGTTVLVTNPAHPITDTNGNLTNLMVTLPSTAKTGTITIKDAAGDTATAKVSVYKPKVTFSASSGSPQSGITVSGKGLWPSQTVFLLAGTTNFCNLTATSTGTVAGSCTVPSMPAGTVALTVQQDSGAISRPAGHLTIVPAINFLPNPTVTGGAVIRVDTYGLAAGAHVTAKLSTVSGNLVTVPASPVTDTSGQMINLMVTIPGVSPGSYTLTISDGTNSASQPITVLAPTVQFTASSGRPGSSFAMTGSGWDTNSGSAIVFFGANQECSASVDSSGDLNGSCTVPSLAAGSYAISVHQDSGAVNVANGNFTIN